MRPLIYAAVAVMLAMPAYAATQTVQLGAHANHAAFTFDGFDSMLGSLQSVQFSLQGSSTIAAMLNQPTSGPITYSATNTLFLYVNNPSAYPAISLTGSGSTTADVGGNLSFTTTGTGPTSAITDASSLQAFATNTSISASFSIDLPTQLSLTYNGQPLTPSNVGIASGLGSGSIVYTYAARGAAVPEPASWALAVAGFGLTGQALRRRCRFAGTLRSA